MITALHLCSSLDGQRGVLVIPGAALHDLLMMLPMQSYIRRRIGFHPRGAAVIVPHGASVPLARFGHVEGVSSVDFSSRKSARVLLEKAKRILRYDYRDGVSVIPVDSIALEPGVLKNRARYRAKTAKGDFVTEDL